MDIKNLLFPVYKYQITTKFIEPATLPPFKGSTLRGAFGIVFKKIICINKEVSNCKECIISSKCVYKQIFEPDIIKGDKKIEISPPFILEPPYDEKTIYKKGDKFEFNCIIIGKVVDYFPYFLLTFKKIGEKGIGIKGNRGRYKLEKIKNSRRIIYDGKKDILKDFKRPVRFTFPQLKNNTLTLKFISPTRIKVDGKLIDNLPFPLFLKVLLRRIYILNKHYLEEENGFDYKKLLEKSNSIITVNSNFKWYDWQRFSYRQKTVMKLGGFTGEITYKGDLKEFLPFIKLGEIIHIGKNTSFGLGKYDII